MDEPALAVAGGPELPVASGDQGDAARARGRARDRAIVIALAVSVLFVAVAIVWPVLAVVGTALTEEAIPIFQRYLTPPQDQIIINTIILGTVVATAGTAIAFLFAFVQVRVPAPAWLKRLLHIVALLPIVSPPFALAVA